MTGGLIQLAAIGAQDIYLIGNPQVTFFVEVYKRHTNFSIECIEQLFTGNTDFGKVVYCQLDRIGDLISNIFLYIKLPKINKELIKQKIKWTNSIGHALIKYIDIEIGGTLIDRQYGIWMEIWGELTINKSKEDAYNEMIGKNIDIDTDNTFDLYIPLNFWFCKNKGLALPLIALQYQHVVINLGIRELRELCITELKLDELDLNKINLKIEECYLLVNYIFLDDDERRYFSQKTHEYLIEQIQFNAVSLSGSKVEVCDDNFKECIPIPEIDNLKPTTNKLLQNTKNKNVIRESGHFDTNLIDLDFNHPIKELIWVIQSSLVLEKTNNGGNQWFNFSFNNNDPMESAKLILDGVDRMSRRQAKYFRIVEPYQRHTNVPTKNFIYNYTFGFCPEELQPSGSLNFSQIDSAILDLKIKPGIKNPILQVFATNYNILKIMGGMSGIRYSN